MIANTDTQQLSPSIRTFRPFPWALLSAILLLWSLVGLVLALGLRMQQGHFSYCLDDAYIHMAMAKNFALHGVWGITPDGFTSSASSLLWPLLIAGVFRLLGPQVLTPFILNLLLATVLLVVIYRLLRRQHVPEWYCAMLLAVLIIAMPLPTMIFSGMEHILQALVAMLFIASAAQAIGDDAPAQFPLTLCLLAPLVTLVRFEGLFLAFAAGLLLLLRRRVLPACLVGVGALLPVIIYALISTGHGWLWLPNSVLLKGTAPHLTSLHGFAVFCAAMWHKLTRVPGVANVVGLALAVYLLNGSRLRKWWSPAQVMLLLFLLVALLHGASAGIPVFYRYEAYLIALGLAALAAPLYTALADGWSRKRAWRAVIILPVILIVTQLLTIRGLGALQRTPRATTNIYRQQLQMARFLHRYYPGASIAANDIGAINFFTDIHCLDMVGLANIEVAHLELQHRCDRAAFDALTRAHHVQVAIIYDHWFTNRIPLSWTPVARWRMPDNVVCGGPVVTFYAVTPGEAAPLATHLKEFTPQLPPEVEVLGMK